MAPRFINQRSSAASDPIRNFRFIVKMTLGDNTPIGPTLGFTSVSGLSMQTEAIPYREGGYHTTMHMLPGQQTFSPVTFQRGVTLGSTQHWDWWRKIFDPGYSASGSGKAPTSATTTFRSQISISVLAHPQPIDTDAQDFAKDPVVARVTLMNAWPTNLAYADFNAGDNGIWVEQMTLVHEGMNIEMADAPTNGGDYPTLLSQP
jgi:phage tail-like protein